MIATICFILKNRCFIVKEGQERKEVRPDKDQRSTMLPKIEIVSTNRKSKIQKQ